MLAVRPQISYERVFNYFKKSENKLVYCANHSCWWTHNPAQLSTWGPSSGPESHPCDPRGDTVFTVPWREFFETAIKSQDKYGKHKLRTLLSAHCENSYNSETARPWSELSWDAYNKALDYYDQYHPTPFVVLQTAYRPKMPNALLKLKRRGLQAPAKRG